MTRLILRAEIKKYRRTLTKAQRNASYSKLKRVPFRMRYPFSVETQVKGKLSNIFNKYTELVYKFVFSRLPPPARRGDGFADEFTIFMRELEAELDITATDGMLGASIDVGPLMRRILEFMARFKEEEIAEYMKNLTGRAFYGTTEWWDTTRTEWVNILNKTVSDNMSAYIDKVRDMVYTSVRQGKGRDYIIARLQEINTSLDDKKAAFLARDMVGKLNGQIEKQLQLSIGIDEYFWQTMNDERVRGRPGGVYADAPYSHWALDSLVCKWGNPSIVSFDYGETWVPRSAIMPLLHPGEDWQCRCSGSPFSLSLLREIDRELALEEST